MNMIEIKKTLWVVFICLMGHIVALAQKYQVRPLDLEQGLSCNYVVSIAQDKYGFLWFATEEGLNRFDGNSFFTYYKQRDRKGISSSELNCVIDDAKKPVVWIGTKNDGLNSFNYQTEEWHSYKHDGKNPSSIATNDITHITPSANGKLWITTYWKGVELFDPETGRFVHFDKDRVQGLPDNQLWCVLDLGNGNLLVGHVKSGLSIMDTQHLTARNFKHNAQDIYSISGNEVICLYRDKKGTIWIGTNMGIDIYDPLSQRFLHVADQTIKNHRIFDFCELPNGNMLVATEQMGIAVLDVANKSFTASTQIPCSFISEGLEEFNLTGNSVRSLLLDKYNNVWAGFYGSGINFLTQSVAPFSTIRAGVPDQLERLTEKSVMGLVFDKNGQLWVGTDGKGLNVFSPEKKRLATYEHEGGSIVAAATRDSNGNLWFGSFFQGATVKNFAMENYVEYSYMLSGLQNDWITAQNGTITLRDIPSGTYQLQVRARFHNQPWSSEIAEFTIIVRPPFWLSWWAKLCYTLFVLAIVYLALRIYQRHLRLKFELKAEKVNHEKEQKLNEERLRFFTNITHELRTPLTLILGPLDDISHSSDITKAVKHKLAVIYQSAVRLNELITQILEFRKTETDNRQLRVVKANVVDAVHEVSLKYEELAQKPDVAIKFVAPENPIMMYIDKEVIAIILDNLVSNAIKYTDQGNIDICVERRRSGERHLVDITVSDTGHGISATALPHIFDRYYQENGPHQASGTGIGLSMVKKLVTLHHGEVKVESNLEQGTSFIVTLDENEIYPDALRGDENASAKLQGNDTASGVLNLEEAVLSVENGKPLLLVVEDNREILDYVAESFIDEFDVLKAGDGREGLALALNKVPDVIISDVMMPNMDGNAMCRALKKDIRTSHIPIILLTAKDSFEAKEKGYDSGADSYITKPFTHLLLRSRILNLLQQRRRDKMLIQESKETNLARKKEQLRESLNKVDQEFFDKLNKLIEENISGDVDVNLIASNLAVSTSTLYRKMKALTGISTNEYIRKYKMQYAEHLLLEGKYSISEISFMVGMNSVAYFRRCFKAEYGEIPSEYLKKLQKM